MKVVPFTLRASENSTVIVEEEKSTNFYCQLHRHKELQISLIVEGEGTLFTGNYMQRFRAGDIYIIGEDQPHMLKRDETCFGMPGVQTIHIYVDTSLLLQLSAITEFKHISTFLKSASSGVQMFLDTNGLAFQTIRKISGLHGFEQMMEVIRLLNFFSQDEANWKSLSSGLSKYAFSESDGVRMTRIYRYTLQHYQNTISLEEIASIASMTPSAFCKYFRKHTRKTYVAFLNEVRINEACKKMLEYHSESISSVAYDCGFNSAITFNRVFKRVTGKTPGEYIREFKVQQKVQYG